MTHEEDSNQVVKNLKAMGYQPPDANMRKRVEAALGVMVPLWRMGPQARQDELFMMTHRGLDAADAAGRPEIAKEAHDFGRCDAAEDVANIILAEIPSFERTGFMDLDIKAALDLVKVAAPKKALAEIGRLREALSDAANALEAVAERTWDKRQFDECRAACDHASEVAGGALEAARASLALGG